MKEILRTSVKDSVSLDQVYNSVVYIFEGLIIKTGQKRLGFVSGTVTSDGEEFIQKNLKRLDAYTAHLKTTNKIPLFSANDIFSDELFKVLDANGAINEDYLNFWRRILYSGYVTDVFMTPRWEKSHGATQEHLTARKLGITIHYVEEKVQECMKCGTIIGVVCGSVEANCRNCGFKDPCC